MRVTGQKTIDKTRINRILIRSTNWIGDVVMSLPAFEAVRENFPKSRISVLARPWVLPLLENHPAVEEVLPYKKGRGPLTALVEIIKVTGLIRQRRFDLAILFQNAFEAALLAFLGRVRNRIGYGTDGRGFLLSHAIPVNDETMKGHQVEYYLDILRAMNWEARSRDPALFIAKRDMEKAHHTLATNGIDQEDYLLGLSPGAVFGPAKRWPPDRFATVGDLAKERWGAKAIVLGSKEEEEICVAVSRGMKHQPLNLCGQTTLGEAMGLIKRCHFFVTNDSGLMHVAAALGVPTVALFGSTDPVATGPRSRKGRIVQHHLDCSPCLKPECHRGYQCLLSIGPEEVWQEMNNLRHDINSKRENSPK